MQQFSSIYPKTTAAAAAAAATAVAAANDMAANCQFTLNICLSWPAHTHPSRSRSNSRVIGGSGGNWGAAVQKQCPPCPPTFQC